MMEIIILLAIIVAYMLIDVHYFVRMTLTCLVSKYLRPKLGLLETNVNYGIALPSDVDLMLDHMTNARFLREFDFGRMELGVRTGVAEKILSKGGGFPINSNFIRYRLLVRPFTLYKTETHVLHWDEKNLYMEQKLITLRDGIVRCVAYPKVTCAKINVLEMLEELFPGLSSPQLAPMFSKINDIGEIISDKFKKQKKMSADLDGNENCQDFYKNLHNQDGSAAFKSIQ